MPSPTEITQLLPVSEVALRLGIATFVGAVIGLNRELRRKPAGLRTQALVTLGSATATLVISELALVSGGSDANAISRVIQGLLTGVGFLGAGVILRDPQEGHVHGLTTAATIWVSATLGLACGAGYWRLSLAVTVLALGILYAGVWVERFFHRASPP